MRKQKIVLNTSKVRILRYLGERYGLPQVIMQGKIQGRRSIRRRRISVLWINLEQLQRRFKLLCVSEEMTHEEEERNFLTVR